MDDWNMEVSFLCGCRPSMFGEWRQNWKCYLNMCLDSVHFPFGSNDVFVRFQWASSYIIISMSVFFLSCKTDTQWSTYWDILGVLACWSSSIINLFWSSLCISATASPGADNHGRTKSHEDQLGEHTGTLGHKMGKGDHQKTRFNGSHWQEIYCAGSIAPVLLPIQRTLEQLGVNFNISSPRYCRPLLISLARGLEDLRCVLIHFCGIVCMTCLWIYKEVLTDINNVLICIHSDSYCIHTAFIFHPA